MKTVCKKLLTFMLVAVMLVSVIPFQALAAGEISVGADDTTALTSGTADANDTLETIIAKCVDTSAYEVTAATWKGTDGSIKGDYNSIDDTARATPITEGSVYFACKALPVKQNVTVNFSGDAGTKTVEAMSNENVADVGTWAFNNWDKKDNYTFDGVEDGGKTVADVGSITVNVTPKATTPPTTEPPTTPTTTEPTTYTIKFMVEGSSNPYHTMPVKEGDVISLPTQPTKANYTFQKWYPEGNTAGTLFDKTVFKAGMPTTYWAMFYSNTGNNDRGDIKVFARYYVGTTYRYEAHLHTLKDIQKGTNVLDLLKNHETETRNALPYHDGDGLYEWRDTYYYDYNTGAKLTSQDLTVNGDQYVFIKLYAKDSVKSNVMLYVHAGIESAGHVFEMPGYLPKDLVTRDDVAAVIKKNYTGSNMKIQGLYDDESFTQLRNGGKPTAANALTVPSDGKILKVHVLLSNATYTGSNGGSSSSSSNGNVDTSNPKTGDSIYVAVTVLGMSAAALAAVYFFEKKRAAR